MKNIKNKSKIVFSILIVLSFFSFFNIYGEESAENKAVLEKERPVVGLVLAGGGAKGFAHLPLIKAIEEMGIPIDFISGASVGAIVGGFYSMGYSVDEIYELMKTADWTSIFVDSPVSLYEEFIGEHSVRNNLLQVRLKNNLSLEMGSGFSNGENAYQLFKSKSLKFPSNTDFDDYPVPFRAVGTNLLTGLSEVLDSGDIAEVIRASMSIPGVFNPIKINDKYYIDGGVTNNLPIQTAVDFGCDIIIAIEISDDVITDPDKFESSPLVAITQIYYMTQAPKTRESYHLADMVLIPDLSDFTVMDFQKGEKIYEASEKSLEQYKPELEKIKNQLVDAGVELSSKKIQPYSEKDYLVVNDLRIINGGRKDKKFINALFSPIKDKALTEKNYNFFVNSIYSTGLYKTVRTRILQEESKVTMEVELELINKERFDILVSADYTGIFGDLNQNEFIFYPTLRYKGITSPNSLLSLKFGLINDFYADLLFLQPFISNFYGKFGARYYANKDSFYSSYEDIYNANARFMNGGRVYGALEYTPFYGCYLQTAVEYTFSNSVGYYADNIKLSKENYPDTKVNHTFNFKEEFRISTFIPFDMDSKGVSFALRDTVLLPVFGENIPGISNFVEMEFKWKANMGKHFSTITNFYMGTECLQNISKMPGIFSTFGYNFGSRTYFPHIADNYDYGNHSLFGAFELQWAPWDDLTLLGGKIYFSAFVNGGNIWLDYKDVGQKFFEDFQWCSGLGAKLNIKDEFNINVRFGLGSSYYGNYAPFISLDVGTMKF